MTDIMNISIYSVKISELFKLLSVKTRMSDDLFHLFGKFDIGHLLSRLSLEKHDGVSASELLALLALLGY